MIALLCVGGMLHGRPVVPGRVVPQRASNANSVARQAAAQAPEVSAGFQIVGAMPTTGARHVPGSIAATVAESHIVLRSGPRCGSSLRNSLGGGTVKNKLATTSVVPASSSAARSLSFHRFRAAINRVP